MKIYRQTNRRQSLYICYLGEENFLPTQIFNIEINHPGIKPHNWLHNYGPPRTCRHCSCCKNGLNSLGITATLPPTGLKAWLTLMRISARCLQDYHNITWHAVIQRSVQTVHACFTILCPTHKRCG